MVKSSLFYDMKYGHSQRRHSSLGLIYKGFYSGWYSVADEAFYSDAQIPRPYNPIFLKFTSVETGASGERRELYVSPLYQCIILPNQTAIMPTQYYADVVVTLKSGELQDLSISRPRARLEWALAYMIKNICTVYVWFDALIAYLTGTGYPWSHEGISQDWSQICKSLVKIHFGVSDQ